MNKLWTIVENLSPIKSDHSQNSKVKQSKMIDSKICTSIEKQQSQFGPWQMTVKAMNLTVPDQTTIIEFTLSLRFKFKFEFYAIFCVTHFRPYLEPVVGDSRTSADLVHFLD